MALSPQRRSRPFKFVSLNGCQGSPCFSCVEIQMYCIFRDMCLIRRGFFVFHFSRLLSDFPVKPSMSEHSTTSTATQFIHTLIACSSFGLNPVHILSPLCQEPSIESVFEVASETLGGKLLENVKGLASRASCKLLEKAKSVASRMSCELQYLRKLGA